MISPFLSPDELEKLGIHAPTALVSRDARLFGPTRIRIGHKVRIDAFTILSAGGSGLLEIGDYVHVGASCRLFGGGGLRVEQFGNISPGSTIFTESDDFLGLAMIGPQIPDHLRRVTSTPVVIGSHAIMGAHSLVLPGGGLGEGTALAAMSMTQLPLDPWSIYRGVPAEKVGRRRQTPRALGEQLLNDSCPAE